MYLIGYHKLQSLFGVLVAILVSMIKKSLTHYFRGLERYDLTLLMIVGVWAMVFAI